MQRTAFNVTTPSFIADFESIDRSGGGRQIDWADAGTGYADAVVVNVTAAALAAATSIAVAALSGSIPSGTVLDFGGDEFARLTADAPVGATTLAVAPLPQALEGGETARYVGPGARKFVRAGTRMRELPNGKIIEHASPTAGGALFGLLETNAAEDDKNAAITGYGVIRGGLVYQALLPETLTAADVTALEGTGKGIVMETYNDNRAG